jgi:hypothetical protein
MNNFTFILLIVLKNNIEVCLFKIAFSRLKKYFLNLEKIECNENFETDCTIHRRYTSRRQPRDKKISFHFFPSIENGGFLYRA